MDSKNTFLAIKWPFLEQPDNRLPDCHGLNQVIFFNIKIQNMYFVTFPWKSVTKWIRSSIHFFDFMITMISSQKLGVPILMQHSVLTLDGLKLGKSILCKKCMH